MPQVYSLPPSPPTFPRIPASMSNAKEYRRASPGLPYRFVAAAYGKQKTVIDSSDAQATKHEMEGGRGSRLFDSRSRSLDDFCNGCTLTLHSPVSVQSGMECGSSLPLSSTKCIAVAISRRGAACCARRSEGNQRLHERLPLFLAPAKRFRYLGKSLIAWTHAKIEYNLAIE
jgi:hypothetical protein